MSDNYTLNQGSLTLAPNQNTVLINQQLAAQAQATTNQAYNQLAQSQINTIASYPGYGSGYGLNQGIGGIQSTGTSTTLGATPINSITSPYITWQHGYPYQTSYHMSINKVENGFILLKGITFSILVCPSNIASQRSKPNALPEQDGIPRSKAL